MQSWILKGVLSFGDWLGRNFIYNINSPKVGKVYKDISYGSHKKQKMDIIIPDKVKDCPVLIFIHGGGWLVGDKTSHRRIGKVFAVQGYLVVNINYRLTPRYQFPVHLQDIAKAIYFIYNNIQDYGGDNTKLFLGGDSAGAHMSSWYTAALNKQKLFEEVYIEEIIPKKYVRGLLLFYGVYDFESVQKTEFFAIQTLSKGFLGKDKKLYKKRIQITSSLRHLSEDYPPVFICSGKRDNLHPESVRFEQKLTQLRIPHEKQFFEENYKCHHGFLNIYFYNCAKIAMRKAGKFMKKCIDYY